MLTDSTIRIMFTAALGGGIFAAAAPVDAGALFRYRSYTGTKPAYVSPHTSAGGIAHSSASGGDVVTRARGTGFAPYHVTDFDGATEFIGATSSINTKPLLQADDSFSIESIFLARSSTGYTTLMSSTQGGGFSLKLHNGRLRGLVRILDSSETLSFEAHSSVDEPVQLNVWHRAVFQVRRNAAANRYELTLYLNGEEVGRTDSPSLYNGIRQSNEPPMVGAEPNGGQAESHWFDGMIHSVAIRRGTLHNTYLTMPFPRDGSPNLGFPAFHEYLDNRTEATEKMANTINRLPAFFQSVLVGAHPAPALNDSYVPQGLSADDYGNLYTSLYWKAPDGAIGQQPSIIVKIDPQGQTKQIIQLLRTNGGIFTGHVGGCTWHNGHVYVPSGSSIFRYDVSNLPAPNYEIDGDTLTNTRADQNRIQPFATYTNLDLKGNTGISFLEFAPGPGGFNYMWVGQYATAGEVNPNRRILGFRIFPNGAISSTPNYNFRLHTTNVQGVALYRVTETEMSFYISRNQGGDGVIYAVDYPLQAEAESILRPARTIGRGPNGVEDLTLVNGNPWTISESACMAYQLNSSPWPDFYPFIYGMKGEHVESGIDDPFVY